MLELLALTAALSTASPAPLPTPQVLPAIKVQAPKATLRLQIARTEGQRERGLMSVTHLPARTGMIFVFDTDGPVAFWMKDTLIPLDMVFVGADGTVRKIYAAVPVVPEDMADDRIPRETGNAKYVIELSSREAAADGLSVGTKLKSLPK